MFESSTDVPVAATDAARKVVYRIPLGDKHELQAYLQEHEGRLLAHLRAMYVRRDGVRRPTMKGVWVEVERVPELLAATAMLVAETRGESVAGA